MTPPPEVNPSARPDRRKFRGVLEIEWGSSMLSAPVQDIGPRGLFVVLVPPLWLGATFSGRLMLDPPVRLNCTVRRVEPGKGFAVTFAPSDKDGEVQLSKLLATLPPV
jgi:hypothetical protein